MEKAEMGVIGLGVMGKMLARNMARNGFKVSGYDLDESKARDFSSCAESEHMKSYTSLPDFVASLTLPRRILLMVPAGKPVDDILAGLQSLLAPGDLIIDSGNSFFQDTERRFRALEEAGIHFMGMGVSGGEQGALLGPSLMPGGTPEAWELCKPVLEKIAARVDDQPCVAYMGPRGAGHYVKMAHNGIEYAEMQLIAETYDLLHRGLGLSNAELSRMFSEWNEGMLASYLIEITANIFRQQDPDTGAALVDLILDQVCQKGTGRWTSQNALDLGVATSIITAAVENRVLSARKEDRVYASTILDGPDGRLDHAEDLEPAVIRDALLAAKICAFAQGFDLLRQAGSEYDYRFDLAEVARIWRGGCIIRAELLKDIRAAYQRNRDVRNLMVDPSIAEMLNATQSTLRATAAAAVKIGIPIPAFGAALAYYDTFRSGRLPANLTQAQRDYFGSHCYQRLDREGDFHTRWGE